MWIPAVSLWKYIDGIVTLACKRHADFSEEIIKYANRRHNYWAGLLLGLCCKTPRDFPFQCTLPLWFQNPYRPHDCKKSCRPQSWRYEAHCSPRTFFRPILTSPYLSKTVSTGSSHSKVVLGQLDNASKGNTVWMYRFLDVRTVNPHSDITKCAFLVICFSPSYHYTQTYCWCRCYHNQGRGRSLMSEMTLVLTPVHSTLGCLSKVTNEVSPGRIKWPSPFRQEMAWNNISLHDRFISPLLV